MANYYCTARTNYFRVKDLETFKSWAEKLGLEIIDREALVGLLPGNHTDDGSFPSYHQDTDTEFDFVGELAEHLADGWIAVVMEAGAEKHRYVSGYAIAINSKGERCQVVLSDIYELAKAKLGGEITEATY